MHYWNKDNFEGLVDLAQELRKTPELAALAAYCTLREKGLRKQAFKHLNEFLAEAKDWDTEQSRRIVPEILRLEARSHKVHTFMTQPLLAGLVFPVLEQWHADDRSAREPLRWLGLLRSDQDALEAYLRIDPCDVPVRKRLIHFALDSADYATHHLSESIMLLPVDKVKASIDQARGLIASAPEPGTFACLTAETNQYEQIVHDWLAYNESSMDTFPKWCAKHGRKYAFPTIVYYDP